METLHPAVANLRPSLKAMKEDEAYYRRIGVAYTAEGLMKVLQDKKPKSALPLVCHSLADIGAAQAVPLLKSLVDFPAADVKATSVLAVARLAGKDETSWMIECLFRKGTDKGYVLWALAAVGDPLACEAVITWFEPVSRKPRKIPQLLRGAMLSSPSRILSRSLHPRQRTCFNDFKRLLSPYHRQLDTRSPITQGFFPLGSSKRTMPNKAFDASFIAESY